MSDDAEQTGGRRFRRALWLVLALAAAIRIVGIFGQGFPFSFYPDETNAVQRALRFGAEHTADPGWFNKPALAYYVWFAAYGAFYATGRVFGQFGSPEEFGVWAFDRMAPFLIIGRLVTTLFGVATVWLTYLLGKALRDRTLGVVGALALAVTYAHVVTSQWVKEDVPCAFFHTAATLLLLSVITKNRVKDSVWSGFLGGLGMATKYYSVGILIPAAFAHLFPARAAPLRRRLALGLLFFALFLVGFFVGSPYNFLRPDFFEQHLLPGIKRMGQLVGLTTFGAIGFPQARRSVFVDGANLSLGDVLYALVDSLYQPEGLGLVFFCLAVGGAALALVRRRRIDVFMLVAVFGQSLFIALSNRQASEPRHLVVLYPLLAVWIADSVIFAALRLRSLFSRWSVLGTSCALLLLLTLVPAGSPSVARMLGERSLEIVRGDTRLAALRWVEANIPEGATVMNDHEVLPLRVNEARSQWAIDKLRRGSKEGYTYRRRWEFRKKSAAADRFRPVYDILVVESWGAETTDELEKHRAMYDTTWPSDVESRPASVPPVARYATTPPAARAVLESRPVDAAELERVWPAAVSRARKDAPPEVLLIDGRPVEWLVSSEVTYDNYRLPIGLHPRRALAVTKKRERFPNRAAFYDDLKAHYDCWEWRGGECGKTGPTIRVYDLRTRVERAPLVRDMYDRGR